MSTVIRFIPVGDINDPLSISIGLSGGSGTGKTYSALLLARGMAKGMTGEANAPIGFVDTENRRALHYKRDFPNMVHFDMKATNDAGEVVGFGPERWIEVIDAAEDAKLPVLVIDSFSHAWEGVGGVLDMHALALDRLVEEAEKRANGRYTVDPAKYSQLAWAEVKPRYRRLIDRIVRANCNIVICTRAKPVMQSGFGDKTKNARKTKTRREDVPWDPASDADLMFEMTAMMILDPAAPGCPKYQIKCADQFKNMFDPFHPMTEEIGERMAEWARGGGNSAQEKALMDEAREVARSGKEAFTAWWNSDAGKDARHIIKPIISQLQEIAAEADQQKQSDNDDPFGLDSEDGPTEAEREAAMEAARAATEDQERSVA